MEKKVI